MKKIAIFNPLNSDFTALYDVESNNSPKSFTIPAKEVREFPELIANHIAKHLINKIFDVRGDVRLDRSIQIKQFEKEVFV